MDYQEAASFLDTLPRFALEGATALAPGLERIEALLAAMGNPHLAYPVVHIAGTNGKGSTASFLASIFSAAGNKAGLHTSPHFIGPAERLRVNGRPAPETWLAAAVTSYREVIQAQRASFFEALVALSLLYFADAQVDVAVVEVGLGGRLDATNIVSPELAIITSIGLDHTQILGDSFRDIAREKAGIIKKGVPVLSGVQQPDAAAEIAQAARRQQAPLVLLDEIAGWQPVGKSAGRSVLNVSTSGGEYDALEIGLPGAYQHRNALLALLAAEMLLGTGEKTTAAIRAGLREVVQRSGLRGRMEIVRQEPLVVLDVGHNPEGLFAALNAMSEMLEEKLGQLFVLFGTMRDKDIHEMARQLSGFGARLFAAPIQTETTHTSRNHAGQNVSTRALPPAELVQTLRLYHLDVTEVHSLEQGLLLFYEEATNRDGLLIIGSHFLVARYYGLTEK